MRYHCASGGDGACGMATEAWAPSPAGPKTHSRKSHPGCWDRDTLNSAVETVEIHEMTNVPSMLVKGGNETVPDQIKKIVFQRE
jgi:hypothetical protein